MYKKVLVPLDGSELAECSLQHIKKLAEGGSLGEVILLNVVVLTLPFQELNVGDMEIASTFDFAAFRTEQLEKGKTYLAEVQSRLASDGIKVTAELKEAERPARAIVDYAHDNGIDMIIISTHGYTGMKKMLFGSVALSVLHESHVPVLLIRPEACRG